MTVMFADLSGFTSISELLDPEDVHAFLAPMMERLVGVVDAYGGRVIRTMGDGLLAVFGAPLAHPDDPERAVRAALALRDAVREGDRAPGIPSELHVGVQTGLVFVIPTGATFDVLGDSVNTASRLLDLAPPGCVLVGDRTHALTDAAVQYRSWEPISVKGKAQPVQAFEAIGVREGVARVGTSFVNRESELATLSVAAERCRVQRSSEMVLLTGMPGIGKSRLIAQFLAGAPDAVSLFGRCAPFAEHVPWFALAEALRAHVGLTGEEDAGFCRTTMMTLARTALPDTADGDLLAAARGLGLLVGVEEAAGARSADAELNWEVATSARRVIGGLAHRRPLILVVEDVQWLDAQSAAFLRWTIQEPFDEPVLIVCAGWPEAAPTLVAGERPPQTISIESLSEEHVATIVKALLPGHVPAGVVAGLAERVAGNPLFLEETVKLLRERGELIYEEERWRLEAAEQLQIPESVRLVVAARIDLLDPQERGLLRDAAVWGPVFTPEDLRALGWEETDDLLAHLLDRNLVARVDRRTFAFAHEVIRDVAYEALPRTARATKHLAIAELLRSADPERRSVEPIAHHQSVAASLIGPSDPRAAAVRSLALTSCVEAGDRSLGRRALQDAERWYGRALSSGRLEPDRETFDDQVAALLRHAEALFELQRLDDARADAERALTAARENSRRRWEGAALLQLGRIATIQGEHAADRLLDEARACFEEVDDPMGRARVLRALGELWGRIDVARMTAAWQEAAILFAEAGAQLHERLVYEDLAWIAVTWHRSEFDRWFAQSEEATEKSGDQRSRAALARTTGARAFYRGELAVARGPLTKAMELARETGDAFVETDGAYLLARIAIEQGDLAAAAELGERLRKLGETRHLPRTAEESAVVLARVALREGRPADCDGLLKDAERILVDAGAEREMAEVTATRAVCALDRGGWSEALAHAGAYHEALVQQGDRLEEPRPLILQSRALLGARDYPGAISLLEDAFSRASGQPDVLGACAALLVQARALVGDVEGALVALEMAPSDGFPEREALHAEAASFIAIARGDDAAASQWLARAIVEWERLGASVWLARALAMTRSFRIGDETKRAEEVLRRVGSDLAATDLSLLAMFD